MHFCRVLPVLNGMAIGLDLAVCVWVEHIAAYNVLSRPGFAANLVAAPASPAKRQCITACLMGAEALNLSCTAVVVLGMHHMTQV